MTDRRKLVVMRHAKAEPYGEVDRARKLTSRGQADALAAGRYLASVGLLPDFGLVSSAARTLATWEQVRAGAGVQPRDEVSDLLYAASADSVLESIRLVPDDARTAIYIGHNPAAAYLASVLHDTDGDPDVLRGLLEGFPTSALAVFELPGDWGDLDEGSARLTHFHVARA